jgi:hypothetical protein
MAYIEVSAKTANNIAEVFKDITKILVESNSSSQVNKIEKINPPKQNEMCCGV